MARLHAGAKRGPSSNGARVPVKALSPEEVKTRLREQGTSLKEWARKHGYSYDTVSCVVRGINRGSYGLGHRIAVALGMKVA